MSIDARLIRVFMIFTNHLVIPDRDRGSTMPDVESDSDPWIPVFTGMTKKEWRVKKPY